MWYGPVEIVLVWLITWLALPIAGVMALIIGLYLYVSVAWSMGMKVIHEVNALIRNDGTTQVFMCRCSGCRYTRYQNQGGMTQP